MPRHYRPDAIEVFNTKGPTGEGFVNLHMPVAVAERVFGVNGNPASAEVAELVKIIRACTEACEDDRNYQEWVTKGGS